MAQPAVRILLLLSLPRLVRDLLASTIARRGDAVEVHDQTSADVVIAGLRGNRWPASLVDAARRRTGLRLYGVTAGPGRADVLELQGLGDLSPEEIVDRAVALRPEER